MKCYNCIYIYTYCFKLIKAQVLLPQSCLCLDPSVWGFRSRDSFVARIARDSLSTRMPDILLSLMCIVVTVKLFNSFALEISSHGYLKDILLLLVYYNFYSHI